MKIIKVINNNAVFAQADGQDAIITGPGIGWKKSVGTEVDLKLVEKVYVPKEQSVAYLECLFRNTDLKYFSLAEVIRIQVQKQLNVKITDQFIFSLADHISHVVKQSQEGVNLPNLILNEIKMLYPKEYQAGKDGLKYINTQLNMELPDDEAGYITLHIINCCLSAIDKNISDILVCTKSISDIVCKHFGDKIENNSFEYYRFLMHLKVLAKRIINGANTFNPDIGTLKPLFLEKNRKIGEIIGEIDEYILQIFGYEMTAEEDVYLFIHILRIIHEECDFK